MCYRRLQLDYIMLFGPHSHRTYLRLGCWSIHLLDVRVITFSCIDTLHIAIPIHQHREGKVPIRVLKLNVHLAKQHFHVFLFCTTLISRHLHHDNSEMWETLLSLQSRV